MGQLGNAKNQGVGLIKTLVTSGCSFTQGQLSWAGFLQQSLGASDFFNLGAAGAGNRYIASSVIDCIEHNRIDPDTAMIMVMWSGPARKDALVSGEYWHLLSDYHLKTSMQNCPDSYWIFSGGKSNSWPDHKETVKLFEQSYLVSDPVTLCKETLENITRLQDYLQMRGFRYRFMSYANVWRSKTESVVNGDYSLAHFVGNLPLYPSLQQNHWVFVNTAFDCIHEFCLERNLLTRDRFHPSPEGHQQFVQQVLLPNINNEA